MRLTPRLTTLLFLTLLATAPPAPAQQSTDIGDYTVHYNALKTSELPTQVAQAYGIQRSSNRALLNITILDRRGDVPTPVRAVVTAEARNLTGQSRSVEMREIEESDEAVYYIGELRVNNMETFKFTVTARVDGRPQPLEITFQQQFYTE